MAFKSVVDYNAERYRGKFRIPSNSESVDVIFMYQSKADMLIGDVHYIKSNEYSGFLPVAIISYFSASKFFIK